MNAKHDDDEKEHVCSAKHSPGHKDILLLQAGFAVGLRLCKLLTSLNPQVNVQLAVQRCQREEGEALAQLGLHWISLY